MGGTLVVPPTSHASQSLSIGSHNISWSTPSGLLSNVRVSTLCNPQVWGSMKIQCFSASSLDLAAAIAHGFDSVLEFSTVQACGLHTVEGCPCDGKYTSAHDSAVERAVRRQVNYPASGNRNYAVAGPSGQPEESIGGRAGRFPGGFGPNPASPIY